MSSLIIVESPTKAKTLARFLGKDFRIEATMGHIRDLPEKKLGIDVDHDFLPQYEPLARRKDRLMELKKLSGEADSIILATDPDREGEAIAWHVAELLKQGSGARNLDSGKKKKSKSPDTQTPKKFSRIVFHEITESAIKEAISHPREIDMPLVDAQQARRVLDRLVGYKLSPLLWNKLGKNWLSAGRVQSVAVKLIVEREREIEKFRPEEYWLIETELAKAEGGKEKFIARLIQIDDKKADVNNKEQADAIVADLQKASYQIVRVDTKETRRFAPAPFTTSTLQQQGSTRFGWSAKRTMQSAQNLYEEGFITYHRTDSTNIAAEAIEMVRGYIQKTYGQEYLPEKPLLYKTKSKVAQEAHEAIRPTKTEDFQVTLAKVNDRLGREAARLYQLIFTRFVACQMKEALYDQTSVDVQAGLPAQAGKYLLRSNGLRMKFAGWQAVYLADSAKKKAETEEENQEEEKTEENRELPLLMVDEIVNLEKVLPQQKFTEPPPRFNEASLIKALEEKGIGRPSTYAPIITTIQDRKYVEKLEKKFKPTELGMTVNDFLVEHFPDVFDITFTAKMEDDLDEIANGSLQWVQVMKDFYYPFKTKIDRVFKEAERVKVDLGETGEICPDDGGKLVFRMSKFGKFMACENFPTCKYTKNIIEKVGIPCPRCGADIVAKRTKTGKQFYGCSNYPTCVFAAWKKEDILKQLPQTESQPAPAMSTASTVSTVH